MKIQNILLLLALTMVVSITSASAAEIDLCAKAVNVSHSWGVCDPNNPVNGTFTYNTAGIPMIYTATASGLSNGVNYSLIYYKDTDVNHVLPSTIAVTVLDTDIAALPGNVSFSGTWVGGNIPAVDDINPKGKIWIVPTLEIKEDGNLTWTGYGQGNIMNGYLFESDSLPEQGNETLTVQQRMGGINYNIATNSSSGGGGGGTINGSVAYGPAIWNSTNFPALVAEETLNVSNIDSRVIPQDALIYSTSGKEKQLMVVEAKYSNYTDAQAAGLERFASNYMATNAGNYTIVGWMGEKYVAIMAKPNKLTKLILEQTGEETKTLTVNETWNLGEGWNLTLNGIDSLASPRQAWLILSKDGMVKDNRIITYGTPNAFPIYTFVERSLGNETDVPVFVTYADNIYQDVVELKYTWLISSNVTKIQAGDWFGLMQVIQAGGNPPSLELKNTNMSITLAQDNTINLMDDIYFIVNNSNNLEYYPMKITATTPDTTPPVITNFTAVPGTHISRSNPTIMSADVTDINLELIDFMVVDINNLVRGNQTMLFRYTDRSGISGKYRSLPWDGTVLDMVNRDGTGNRTYITSMYVDNSECSDCQGTVMSPVQFKKNGTTAPVEGWAWFNRSTGNLSSLNLPDGYAEIEDGISTISVIKLVFTNGIEQAPVDHISDKTYIIYDIAGERSNLNPVLVSEPVPDGNYNIKVHAQDTADNHNARESDISVGESLYGVRLIADSLAKMTQPGVNAAYVLNVYNTGNTADTYELTVNSPDGASWSLTGSSVSLAPGENQSVLLNVSAYVGTYRVNVTATSNNDPSKNATVNTITKVLMAGITGFNASNGSRAGAIIANITVKNFDTTGHWYAVVAGGTDPVKGYPLAGTGVVYLDAGQEMKVPVLVTVPPSTSAGTYPIFAALYPYDSQILDPVSLIGQITGPKTVVVR